MNYTLNTTVLGNTFVVPSLVADNFLKIATAVQIKVLLYFMRNLSDGIDVQKIATALSLPESEVDDALLFWSQSGVLNLEIPKAKENKVVIINSNPPSRLDVIKRGLEDKNLMFLLREAQLSFGRSLKQNESQLLVSLYDDYGMPVSVIMLLLGYATSQGRCNLSFVKKIATTWINEGVETVEDAERVIEEEAKQNLAWNIVQKAFGIERRKPSTKELQYSNLWINEWKVNTELLKAVYDACIDTKTKLSIPYIAKILENCNKKGITTAAEFVAEREREVERRTRKTPPTYAGYDLNEYEKMLKKKLEGEGDINDA